MSREGRWRLVMATLRGLAVLIALGLVGAGVRLVYVSLQENPKTIPAVARATPMKPAELRTDGVLDATWLADTLALPKGTSLMDLDLQQLRTRLMQDNQVFNATLTRNFPDRLVVQISERAPVARVKIEWMDEQRTLLVARDGVIYAGRGYAPALLETLPWLDGVAITPQGGGFRPIAGMEIAAELLAKARLEAEHLYNTWSVISLARLATDHRLEVRSKDGTCTVYFTTRDDFFRQLAKLNHITEQLAGKPVAKATIDISLSPDVPVMIEPATTAEAPKGGHATPPPTDTRLTSESPLRIGATAAMLQQARSERALFVLPQSQPSKTHREL